MRFPLIPTRYVAWLIAAMLALPTAGVCAQASAAPRLELVSVGAFDPLGETVLHRAAVPELPDGLAPSPARRRYAIVQFDARIEAADRRRLAAAGARVISYVPRHAVSVALEGDVSVTTLAELDGVRWVGPFRPEYKLDPALQLALGRSRPGPLPLVAQLFAGEDVDRLASRVSELFGATELGFVRRAGAGRGSRLTLRASASSARAVVAWLAHSEAVAFVFLDSTPRLDNDHLVWTGQSYDRALGPLEAETNMIGGPLPSAATIWARGLLGNGQIVAVADTGLDPETCAWSDDTLPVAVQQVPPPGQLAVDGAHRKIVALNGVNPETLDHFDTFRHGTHVASTVAGSVAPSAGGGPPGHNTGDGVAPAARIVFEDIGGPRDSDCLSSLAIDSLELLLRQEYDAGARISTNSWSVGNAGPGEIDVMIWDHEEFLTLTSAGNSGASGLNGMAQHKNGVSVGAGENWDQTFAGEFGPLDPENLAAFSSIGPASDGRIKPDIVAPGYLVRSNRYPTMYTTDPGVCLGGDPSAEVCVPSFGGCYVTYTDQSCELVPMLGTSMATPAVAGFAALARQYFMDGFYPTGLPDVADARTPSAALLKAVLLNGARNMTGRRLERRGASPTDHGPLTDAPSPQQGWGRVMLEDALYFDGDARRLLLVDAPNSTGLTQGESASLDLGVSDVGQPLKLTLVWTDPPAASYAASALVNDLDLVLEAPDGTIYRGNQFLPDDPAVPGDKVSQPAAIESDQLNNVEGILIPTPLAGSYSVSVIASNVPGFESSLTQGYALVVTGGLGAVGGGGGCPARLDLPGAGVSGDGVVEFRRGPCASVQRAVGVDRRVTRRGLMDHAVSSPGGS